MVKHIVMWKVKDNVDGKGKEENAINVKKKMEELNGKIDEIITLEIGINIVDDPMAHDIILYSEFNSVEDLNIYQKHPEHLKVVEYVKPFLESRIVVDYEI